MEVKFPSHFLWGAALSSHQCEGENLNSDWYVWEKEKNLEISGRACDHYRLFNKDFELASQLNLSSLRFSVEWARVQPKESVFSEQELEHYLEVVSSLLKHRIKPLVTLHHFTNPIWFSQSGGWTRQYFHEWNRRYS